MSLYVIYRTGAAVRRASAVTSSISRRSSNDSESQGSTDPGSPGRAWLDCRFCDSPESMSSTSVSNQLDDSGTVTNGHHPDEPSMPASLLPLPSVPLPEVPMSPLEADGPLSLANFGEENGQVIYDSRISLRQRALAAQTHAPILDSHTQTSPPPPFSMAKSNLHSGYGTVYYDSRESLQSAQNAQTSASALGLTVVPYCLRPFPRWYGPGYGTVYYDSAISLLQRAMERSESAAAVVGANGRPPSTPSPTLDPGLDRQRPLVRRAHTHSICPSAKVLKPTFYRTK